MDKYFSILNNFCANHIIVVGDIMLDRYLYTTVERISPEAPIPIAKVIKEDSVLGGASNVAANFANLGNQVELIGVVGDDVNAQTVIALCKSNKIRITGVVVDSKPTIVKSRILCNSQQLLRIDREEVYEVEKDVEDKILKNISNRLKPNTVIVFSDYAKHLFSIDFHQKLINLQAMNNVKLFVDAKPKNIEKFKNSYLIKPNRIEAEVITGMKITDNLSNVKEVCLALRNKVCANVMITLSQNGLAVLFEDDFFVIPTKAKEVFDVSGAGDTTMASFVASIAAGADIRSAAELSNICAGIVVAKIGTATCSLEELLHNLKYNTN